eukprot:3362767-Amphidinium_carterae.1
MSCLASPKKQTNFRQLFRIDPQALILRSDNTPAKVNVDCNDALLQWKPDLWARVQTMCGMTSKQIPSKRSLCEQLLEDVDASIGMSLSIGSSLVNSKSELSVHE